jgi:hypothetical protein
LLERPRLLPRAAKRLPWPLWVGAYIDRRAAVRARVRNSLSGRGRGRGRGRGTLPGGGGAHPASPSAQASSAPDQSKGKCLLDRPGQLHLRPNASTSSSLVDEEAHGRPRCLAGPQVSLERTRPDDIQPIERHVAIVFVANVPGEDAVAFFPHPAPGRRYSRRAPCTCIRRTSRQRVASAEPQPSLPP